MLFPFYYDQYARHRYLGIPLKRSHAIFTRLYEILFVVFCLYWSHPLCVLFYWLLRKSAVFDDRVIDFLDFALCLCFASMHSIFSVGLCTHTYAPVYASQRYQFQPDCLSMTRDSNRKPSYYTLLLLLSLVVHNEQPHLNSCMKAKFVIQTKEAFDIYSYSEFLLLLLLLSKL